MGAIPRGFESLPLRQLVASDISLATSFFISLQSSSRAHSAAPRFQITTAALGCDLVLGVELRAAGIYTVAMFHVGAKSALLRRLFMPAAKKTPSACSLAPPLQIEPAALGFDLVFGADLWAAASFSATKDTSPRTSYRSRRLFCKRHLSLICRGSHPNHNRVAGLWFDFRVRFRGVAFRQGMENNRE